VQDTGDNAADFNLVSTDAALIDGVQPVLGAPGPENNTSPLYRDRELLPSYVDPGSAGTAPPNRVSQLCGSAGAPPCPGDPNTSTGGRYLSIRRQFTNMTNSPVTRLRFRVVDVSTLGSPGGPQADLRVITSPDTTANTSRARRLSSVPINRPAAAASIHH
jgi:hypothetical protein